MAQYLQGGVPKGHERKTLSQVWKSRTPGCKMQDHTKTIGPKGTTLATIQEACSMASKTTDQGNRHRVGTQAVGKKRKSPVRDWLRDRPERNPIITANYYTSLINTEILDQEKDHIIVKVQLHGEEETVMMNAIVYSGATEDFIDSEVCKKQSIKMVKARNPRGIYLAGGKPSVMGRVSHMREVPMDISSLRELATFQGANLQHHEVILGMPWL